jgi:D-aminoacyl-tRNA deacylase
MMYAIVYSLGDPAGSGAASELTSALGRGEACQLPRPGARCTLYRDLRVLVAGFSDDVVHFEFLDDVMVGFNISAYIVLSRHSSASREPTLSIHHPGNPGPEAAHGGRPRELAIAFPRLAKALLVAYYRAARQLGLLSEYKLTLEATHHGPTSLRRPIVFIEIGSSEDRWRDRRAQQALAEAVAEAVVAEKLPACKPVVGLGDTHYPRVHTRLMLETDMCYGHILAKHSLGYVDETIIRQAVEKSVDPIAAIVVQKVPSRVRRLVERLASELSIQLVRA